MGAVGVSDRDSEFQLPPFAFLKAKETLHGHRHYGWSWMECTLVSKPFDRSPIWLPSGSALVSIDKLTDRPSIFLETAKVRSVELIVDT